MKHWYSQSQVHLLRAQESHGCDHLKKKIFYQLKSFSKYFHVEVGKCCFNTPYKLNYYIAWYEYIISFIHKLINDKLNVKVFELKTKNMQSKIDKWYAKKFYNQSKSNLKILLSSDLIFV